MGYSDTSARALKVQIEAYRVMGPSRRLEIAFELSEALLATFISGIRSRHPDYSDQEVKRAAARLLLGEHLFRLAYSGDVVWMDEEAPVL